MQVLIYGMRGLVMTYEEIRAARLQKPFRPFKIRMKSGEEHLIPQPARLAISERIVAFVNPETGVIEHWSPKAIESLTFVDEANTLKA
jgi:hypothetical protein